MKKFALQPYLMVCLLTAIMIIAVFGCGKKAPPLPPVVTGNQIASPSDLTYAVSGDTLSLTWTHRSDEQSAKIQPDAFDVFLVKKTFEDCEGCPFKFELVATVPMPDITFTMTLEKGYRYYLRLQAVNDDGVKSDYSKTVQYDYK